MDILVHALWTARAVLSLRRRLRRPLSLSWAIFRCVFPDACACAMPAMVRIWWSSRRHDFILLPHVNGISALYGWVSCEHSRSSLGWYSAWLQQSLRSWKCWRGAWIFRSTFPPIQGFSPGIFPVRCRPMGSPGLVGKTMGSCGRQLRSTVPAVPGDVDWANQG